jgi:arylsulfatase A-like enzyme
MRTSPGRLVSDGFRLAGALVAGLLASLGPASLPAQPAADAPPNFLVIMVDDLGYGDLGCYGGRARTPHIDRLAREGLRATDFHSNGAVCSPTRAAFLTGRYQQRSGILTALGENARGLPQTERTVATMLRQRGYATALFGKWHLGYQHENGPLRHGFDEFRGHLHGAVDYVSKVDQFGRVDWWHNEQPAVEATYATEIITRDVLAFLTARRDRPFFAFVSHTAIHFPWQAPGDGAHRRAGVRFQDTSGPYSKLGPHSGDLGDVVRRMIEAVDQSTGQILDRLRELGLDRRTLVVFTSDNGGILEYRGGYTNISSNGPLRGAKAGIHEGGHRVPAIFRWPGRIAPGSVSAATMLSMDLAPTLLELAGAAFPPADGPRAFDGVSLLPVLSGGALAPRDVYWRLADERSARAVRRGDWKLIVPAGGAPELYDLAKDLGEARNVAAAHPETVAALQASLAGWARAVAGTRSTP